jgi:bifunctional non-homologous end joining protein LigD
LVTDRGLTLSGLPHSFVAAIANQKTLCLMVTMLWRTPFSRAGWLFELKYDGFRCLVRKIGAGVDLLSRQGNLLNRSLPDIEAAVASVAGDFIWDVESHGRRPARPFVVRAASNPRTHHIPEKPSSRHARAPGSDLRVRHAAKGQKDIRHLPLEQRKRVLRNSFGDTGILVYVKGIVAAGGWVFMEAVKRDLEGIVAQRLDSPYRRGLSPDWLKIKNPTYDRTLTRR